MLKDETRPSCRSVRRADCLSQRPQAASNSYRPLVLFAAISLNQVMLLSTHKTPYPSLVELAYECEFEMITKNCLRRHGIWHTMPPPNKPRR
jgi:hypothetical protein